MTTATINSPCPKNCTEECRAHWSFGDSGEATTCICDRGHKWRVNDSGHWSFEDAPAEYCNDCGAEPE